MNSAEFEIKPKFAGNVQTALPAVQGNNLNAYVFRRFFLSDCTTLLLVRLFNLSEKDMFHSFLNHIQK